MKKFIKPSCLIVIISLFSIAISGCDNKQSKDKYPKPGISVDSQSLNNWSYESSIMNGMILKEDKSIYSSESYTEVTTFYITVYPTKNENDETVTFEDFNKHEARDRSYNPEVKVLIQQGNSDGILKGGLGYSDTSPNATIRVRGNSSRGALFKSYKVKFFDSAGDWKGQTTLNLNKHVNDVSKVSNKFCMDSIAKLDNMASFQTNFTRVYIKDLSKADPDKDFTYYGLYTNIEQPNKGYLRKRSFDENGSLYKAINFEFRYEPEILKNVDDPTYDEAKFETVLKIREGKDHSKLIQMLKDVNDMNKDFNEVFSKYFNLDNYLTWMAVNFLFGNEDTIAHNFIIYNPSNSLTWYFLPWDYDGTFKFGEYKSSYQVPEELFGIPRYSGVILHRRFLQNPENVQKLINKVNEVHDILNKESTQGLVDNYKIVLRDFMTKYPDLNCSEVPPNKLESYLDGFPIFIEDNYNKFFRTLEYPTPIFSIDPERQGDGRVRFAWDSSSDLQGDLLKYDITVSTDPGMKNIVYSQNDYIGTEVFIENLPPGEYYQKLMIKDDKGNLQYSSYNYMDIPNKINYWGVRKIIIN